ncbi:MAG: MerR family transcriptional regulator [Actinomycetota bacterium]|nr:MerR family transcriptional regulator [Actinomycetota bacterium]
MEHLLSIGAFSRRCGMSISALRFYGECRLIIPRAVNESTGYRYYGEDQLEQARLVRHLRGAELPVESVRRFLSADDEGRRRALDAHGAELAARAGALQRSLDEARRLLRPSSAGEAERCCIVDARALAVAFG